MQIQNIQRPTLFSDFFGLELIWSNDYLEYINTNNHKFVTSLLNTTKKTIKNSCVLLKKHDKSRSRNNRLSLM